MTTVPHAASILVGTCYMKLFLKRRPKTPSKERDHKHGSVQQCVSEFDGILDEAGTGT